MDECEEPDKCGPNTKCHNDPGTYSCSCQEGFSTGLHTLNCTGLHMGVNKSFFK